MYKKKQLKQESGQIYILQFFITSIEIKTKIVQIIFLMEFNKLNSTIKANIS